MAEPSKQRKSSRFLVGLGIVLICIGLANLVNTLLPPQVVMAATAFVRGMWNVAWPLALMALGVYLLWAAKTGRLARSGAGKMQGSLRRSRTDKRFFGICGGLARYLSVDSSIVRLVAVLLLVFLTPLPVVAYFVLAVAIPSE